MTLAFEHAFRLGESRVSAEVVEQVLSHAIDELEPTLTRNGYDAPALTALLNAKPAEVRDFPPARLPPTAPASSPSSYALQESRCEPGRRNSLAGIVSTTVRWRAVFGRLLVFGERTFFCRCCDALSAAGRPRPFCAPHGPPAM